MKKIKCIRYECPEPSVAGTISGGSNLRVEIADRTIIIFDEGAIMNIFPTNTLIRVEFEE